MKRLIFLSLLLVLPFFTAHAQTTKKRLAKKSFAAPKSVTNNNTAIVFDERLAVLRVEPSLFARPIQRLRMGRIVQISGSKKADGVTFYLVKALPNNVGWVQSEAVVGKSKSGDDARLARLVQASDGFAQIECAMLFLETFKDSALRPPILLLLGDLTEEAALKISADAARRLSRREMAASGAPLHSFYLNYVSLDRYRRLGIRFLFNPSMRLLHYDGAAWKEIINRFPKSDEAAEAQKRLDTLKEKMEVVDSEK